MDLHAQAPQQTPQSEEVCKAQQLRRDAATFFKSFGGTNSRWYRWTLLLPRMGETIHQSDVCDQFWDPSYLWMFAPRACIYLLSSGSVVD